MLFRVLGPLEVSVDKRQIALGGPKQRSVLASLLVRPNQVVPAENLIDQLWGEDPPNTARKTLQGYVTHLRRALGPDRLEWQAPGYVLRVGPRELDAARFEVLVHEARAAKVRLDRASALYRRALEQWRGPAFADLPRDGPLAAEAHRLEELRLEAVEGRIAADLDAGRHDELIPELAALTREQPLRERLWGLLMVALYRSGRQADASAAYHQARQVLAEELGLDPSQELRGLHDRILRNDPTLQAPHERLRGYELVEEIGEGGFGVVYRAWQPQLAREVAVKAIRPALANDPEFIRRFEAEAQLVARLEHANIVPLYDYWREPGAAYLVLRWIRGGSLDETSRRSPFDLETVARLEEQVASALSFAHRLGVVHSDLKPANVLLDEEGNAYLSDFGIAADLRGLRSEERDLRVSPAYLSPEQIQGEPATPATDIYCLGLLLYQVLCGEHPFSGTPPVALLQKQLHEPLPPVTARRPELPGAIDHVIARATAKDPAARFPDLAAFDLAFREALRLDRTRTTLGAEVELANPYKGLRPFDEADAPDFFGREALVERLVARLSETVEGSRFLGVVGPSGSGKSSVVRAGLVPALRKGAIHGSEAWFFVDMSPGALPFEELEAALRRIAVNPPGSLLEQLENEGSGFLRAVERALPPDGSELLLVIDQFEELFTRVEDEEVRARFMASLVSAATDPDSRIRIVVTLRGDFYDRPLGYQAFGELLGARTQTVGPLSPQELERAVAGPAEHVGVTPEPALLAEVVADAADRPGALPLLQYALTEVFERRRNGSLTLADYQGVGGLGGALADRAEHLYGSRDDAYRETIRQMFLHIVDVEDVVEGLRRRVRRSELGAMEVDPAAMALAIDEFENQRFLTFDRDPVTREPTVEVAHEALLWGWHRLTEWIEIARDDVRAERRLAAEAADWEEAGRDPSFLLRGSRLGQFEAWAAETTVALASGDREYLTASIDQREQERRVEEAQRERESSLKRRSVVRLRALVAVLTVGALVAATLALVAADRGRRAEREARVATARELAAASVASLGEDAERSLLLALEAVETTYRADRTVLTEAEQALHWALQARPPIVTIPGDAGRVTVAFSPDGRRLLLAHGVGPRADVYDADTGAPLLTVQAKGDAIVQVDYSPDGRLFATSSFGNGGYTRVWDAVTGQQVWRLGLPDGTPLCCNPRFSPGGRFLATFASDGTTYLWDMQTGRKVNRFDGIGEVFSPDRGWMLISDFESHADVVDWHYPHGGRRIFSLLGKTGLFPNASWSPDGRMIATLTSEQVILWDARTGNKMFAIFPPVGSFAPGGSPLDFSPDSTRLATGMEDGTAIVWEVFPDGAKPALTLVGHEARVGYVVFSPNGTFLATGSPDGTAQIYDVSPAGERERLTVPGFTGIAYSPGGRRLATGSKDGPVTVYEATSGRRLLVLSGHTGWVRALDFSSDGSRLASGASDGTVRIWGASSGAELVTMEERAPDDSPAHIADVKFSPDGDTVATTSSGSSRLWDAATGKLLHILRNPDGEPALGRFSVAFSPNGRLLAGEDNGTYYLWRVDDGQILTQLPEPTAPNLVAFSPDGRHLVTTGNDGSLRLWDARTGRQIRAVSPNLGTVFGLAFSPDGSRLGTVSTDGTVRLWYGRTLQQKLIVDRQAWPSALTGSIWPRPGATVRFASMCSPSTS